MLPFESGEYPAPKGYDSLLTNMYGDYMKPPEDDEKSGHFTYFERLITMQDGTKIPMDDILSIDGELFLSLE